MRFAKNLAWLVMSEGVSRVVQFVALGYLARVLGTAGLGTFNWVQSVGLTLALLPNFGLNEYGVLKVSPNRSLANISEVTSSVLSFRMVLGVVSIMALAVCTTLVPGFAGYERMLLTAGLLQVATVFTFDWFYTAVERQATVGIARLVARAAYLVATLIFVRTADDVLLALMLFFCAEVGLSAALFALSFRVSPWTFSFTGAARARTVLKEAWPLAIYVANAGLLYYIDIVIIGLRLPMAEAGLYAGGMRIVAGLIALKFLIGQLVYPKLARRVASPADAPELGRLVSVINRYGLMLGIGIFTMTAVFAREIVWLVLGSQFVAGWWVFALLSVVLVAEFGWLAYPYLVISMNLRAYAAIMVCMGALKIAGLYFVLPRGGLLGAALVYLAASLLVFFASIAYVGRRLVTLPALKLVAIPVVYVAVVLAFALLESSFGLRLLGAVGLMGVAVLYLRSLGQRFAWSTVKDDLVAINV